MLTYNGKPVSDKTCELFLSKVIQAGSNDCWIWNAGMNSLRSTVNYGMFWVNGKKILAHRFALALSKGTMVSLNVIHSCDNPSCCNPSHLREGTQKENMKDCSDRGRVHIEKGVERYNAKLTDKTVREIRNLYAMHLVYKKITLRFLGRKYGVDASLIRRVVSGRGWAHVK